MKGWVVGQAGSGASKMGGDGYTQVGNAPVRDRWASRQSRAARGADLRHR